MGGDDPYLKKLYELEAKVKFTGEMIIAIVGFGVGWFVYDNFRTEWGWDKDTAIWPGLIAALVVGALLKRYLDSN